MIGLGAPNLAGRGRYRDRYRIAALGQLSSRVSRLRMHGSTAADVAFTAAGNAGDIHSPSVVVGAPGVHEDYLPEVAEPDVTEQPETELT